VHALSRVLPTQDLWSSPYMVLRGWNSSILVQKYSRHPNTEPLVVFGLYLIILLYKTVQASQNIRSGHNYRTGHSISGPFENLTKKVSKKSPFEYRTVRYSEGYCIPILNIFSYTILVVEQVSGESFNRAKLFNIGYQELKVHQLLTFVLPSIIYFLCFFFLFFYFLFFPFLISFKIYILFFYFLP
jgi:hypothetical protein